MMKRRKRFDEINFRMEVCNRFDEEIWNTKSWINLFATEFQVRAVRLTLDKGVV